MLLHFVGARTASLQLAILALEDEPMRPRVAHGADPLDQGRFRFQQVEGMIAISRDSHCDSEGLVDVEGSVGVAGLRGRLAWGG